MNETRLLRRVIHYIWECYRDKGEMKIRLENHAGDELHIEERSDAFRVTVRYFAKEPSGELVKQMEVLCFVLHYGEWVPLELYKDGSTTVYGTFNIETGKAQVTDSQGQWKAAGHCDAWALQLLEGGFLASAAKLNPLGTNPPLHAMWPQPTIPAPSLEQIEEWMWEDGGCEATDACWVEVDGICPHSHPSWLLRLGLV